MNYLRSSITLLLQLAFLGIGFIENMKAQEDSDHKIDSIYKLKFEAQLDIFEPLKKDKPVRYRKNANLLLQKAQSAKNISKQADAYYLFLLISERAKALEYADSIIALTENTTDFTYPARAYLKKASIFGSHGDFENAMIALLKANAFAVKNKNQDQEYRVKFYMAVLKNDIGEENEALRIMKSVKKFRERKFLESPNAASRSEYLRTLFVLGDSYNRQRILDSAYITTSEGIRIALKSKDTLHYGRLLLSSGITHFFANDYNKANDSILKYKALHAKDSVKPVNFMVADMYLGQSYFGANKREQAIPYLKAVDSVAFSKQHFFPTQRPIFMLLVDYYKNNGDISKQLHYINKLISFDSIISTNFRHFQKEINSKYETPQLLSQKELLISELKDKNEIKDSYLWIASTILSCLAVLLAWSLYRNKVYKNRFLKVINRNEKQETATINENYHTNDQELGVPDSIVKEILNALDDFEATKKFLETDVTVHNLAKEFNTNAKYLSKIVNTQKGKSFSNYVNDLRINQCINRLRQEIKFKNYKIKIIAEESGFNTAQAFSKSFYKNTGMQPSFFIKELKKTTQIAVSVK